MVESILQEPSFFRLLQSKIDSTKNTRMLCDSFWSFFFCFDLRCKLSFRGHSVDPRFFQTSRVKLYPGSSDIIWLSKTRPLMSIITHDIVFITCVTYVYIKQWIFFHRKTFQKQQKVPLWKFSKM